MSTDSFGMCERQSRIHIRLHKKRNSCTNWRPASLVFLPEMVVPDNADWKAVKKCGETMAYMLQIGWTKESIPELERLWWSVHDERGNVRVGDARKGVAG